MKADDVISDTNKDTIGNLALLDAGTNRSYGNAPFPVKRRRVLLEAREQGTYIPPCTEAAFAKSYSSGAAQMRLWSESDAKAYSEAMKMAFNGFMNKAQEDA